MKHCPKCNRDLPESEFGIRRTSKDGLRATCRKCAQAYQPTSLRRQWRSYWERERGKDNTRKERRIRYEANNPEKVRARVAARVAFRNPEKCTVDGCQETGERHHPDYGHPTEIMWLCRRHHNEAHRGQRTEP